ncbi:helix-turn-helix domain-containing protein [Streptomyces sp. XD-27]|uniref:helix-turn-helix domain-containing protein n=1 Tax=Streptomyces sp. XD-27 TaxID=3062779 RepID=UPI0026F4588A|nr:helix-turn-helix transcriptional regulator [Streptomyces sp. XD-27]WKX73591.1 helix-turn-helix transcriptional regulator [Streptomyces sp. XD-27]
MRARLSLRPREAWRHAHGLTLQQAADKVNDLGARRPGEAVSADASLMSKWERWPAASGRRPTPATLPALAAVYECEVEELLDLEDRQAMPPGELRLLQRPHDLAAPVTSEALVRSAAEESADWARWAEASNCGETPVQQLVATTRSLARDYLTHAEPVRLFHRARRLRDTAFGLLKGHQYPRQTADLYAVAGYLCTLLAWMSSDLGQLDDADTQGRTPWVCAQKADSDDLRAWVLSTRAKIAFWNGHLHAAVDHAQHGQTYRGSGTVGTLLACQQADALAQQRRMDPVTRRLGELAATAARSTLADSRPGRELQGRIEAFCRHSAPRLALSPGTLCS